MTKPDRAGVTVGGRHFFQGRDDIVSFPVALCILRRAVSESHDDNDACVQPYYSSVAGGKLDASRVKVTSSLPQLDKHVHEVLAFPASSTSVDTTPTGQLPRHSVPLPSRERMLKRVGHACAIYVPNYEGHHSGQPCRRSGGWLRALMCSGVRDGSDRGSM